MYLSERNFNKTNSLLKEALTLQTGNGELRALYTYFLIESNQLKQARDFAVATLKDHDKQDIKGQGHLRVHPALTPRCAFAAHGLAIALAKHALGLGGPAAYNAHPISSASESSILRVKNLCDSITILNKVREALNDGSVYVNLGHYHYLRDKFERSIENLLGGSTKGKMLRFFFTWRELGIRKLAKIRASSQLCPEGIEPGTSASRLKLLPTELSALLGLELNYCTLRTTLASPGGIKPGTSASRLKLLPTELSALLGLELNFCTLRTTLASPGVCLEQNQLQQARELHNQDSAIA
ncbi:hypothetical protein BY996DRAFT_6414003 [Phakopsora pachyrhizi]|nr:hypothetical protein BY996DRAFT_6414003 [Phakopsora pachyrhizi]